MKKRNVILEKVRQKPEPKQQIESDPFADLDDCVKGLVSDHQQMKNYTVNDKIKHQQAFLTNLEYPKKWNHSQFVRDAINDKLKAMTDIDWPASIDPNT